MKLIHYTYHESEFYRDDIKISREDVEKELNKAQYKHLLKNGKCGIRHKVNKSNCVYISDDKLFDINRHNYRLVWTPYNHTRKLGIERLNKKYGYYNFVSYIESENDYKSTVISDIKIQAELQLQKKRARIIASEG